MGLKEAGAGVGSPRVLVNYKPGISGVPPDTPGLTSLQGQPQPLQAIPTCRGRSSWIPPTHTGNLAGNLHGASGDSRADSGILKKGESWTAQRKLCPPSGRH